MTEALFIQFTALLASALLIPAVVFFALWLSNRKQGFWIVSAASYAAMFAGSFFGALRAMLPEIVTILVSNSMIALGYFLCLRSLRIIKKEWRFCGYDTVTVLVFLVAFILIVNTNNTYEARVAVVAIFIALMSIYAACLTFYSKARFSSIGDTAIILFGIGNFFFATARAVAALSNSSSPYLGLEIWDPVFFVWSIAAVFCFAIGVFINGTALLSKELHDSLEKQKMLGNDLAEALENQRNLQKLLLHEIKRPINSISSLLQYMRSEPKDATEELKSLVVLVQQANTFLEGIGEFEEINSLLDNPDITEINVEDFAADIRSKWGVEVSIPQDLSGTIVFADKLLLEIALSNLIENAQKYGLGISPITVCLSTSEGRIIFDVMDDGLGIPTDESVKVFGKFYKIADTSKSAIRGCGLGLYVVQRIAKIHGGFTRVMSASPSTVRFCIPLKARKDL